MTNTFETADAARRRAMVDRDVEALAALLDDDLTWTHSSGRTDSKVAVLDTIRAGDTRYLALDTEAVSVRELGAAVVATGIVYGRVSSAGAERDLRNKFISVWQREGGALRMMAWQSTGL